MTPLTSSARRLTLPVLYALRRCLPRSFLLMLGTSAFLIFSSGCLLPLSLSAATLEKGTAPITGVITTPGQHAQVLQVQTVAGTVTGLTAGQYLWLLVVPHVLGAVAYHPQPDLTVNGNNWTVTAHIGLAGDVGREFDLELIAADNRADMSFRQYLASAAAARSYPGILSLPHGVLLLQSIEVRREGSSAGGGGTSWWIFVLLPVGAVAVLATAAWLVRQSIDKKRLTG